MRQFYTCLLLLLTGIGLNTYAQISINIVSPAAPYIVDTTVNLELSVTSTYSVASVKGAVSGRQTTLTYTAPRYYGRINVADLPFDTLLLTITVTDVLGNIKDTSMNVIHDSPPTVAIDSLLYYGVATPTLHLKALVSDNDAIKNITLNSYYFHYPLHGNTIDTVLNLLGGDIIDGSEVLLWITATDNLNQTTTHEFTVYVESSPYLERVFTSPYRGKIVDYKYNKVLINDVDSLQHRIVDVQTKAMSAIPVHKPLLDQEAFLTPYGAFFATETPSSFYPENVFEFYNGAIRFQEIREDGDPNRKLVVGGNYAVLNRHFPGGRDPDTDSIVIRDLSTGINRNVLYYYFSYSALLADNGMAFLFNGGPYSYNAPQNQLNSTKYLFSSPMFSTDGTRLLFGGSNPANPGGNFEWDRLYLSDSTYTTQLITNYLSNRKKTNPKVNNGYVAYVRGDSLLIDTHVYLRDAAGNEQQKSFWAKSNFLTEKIKALDSSGNFIFAEASYAPTLTPERGYYYAGPNGATIKLTDYVVYNQKLGSDNVGEGNDVFIENGQFFIAIGNTLFRVNPNAQSSLTSFQVAMRQDSVYKFTTEEFTTNYTGTAPLVNVKIITGPSHGVLSISGHTITADSVIVANRLALLRYTPAAGYIGADTIIWNASSDGSTYAANNALITFTITAADPLPIPVISGINTQYCSNGDRIGGKILNAPPPSDVTKLVTLDNLHVLPLVIDSYFVIKPDTLSAGTHQVTVRFSNAIDTTSTTVSFTVLPVTIPDLVLTANITTVNTPSDTVTITAQVPVGYKNALYTFAWDTNFNNILQWQSVDNTVTIPPGDFAVGNNTVYGIVHTGNTCSPYLVVKDSIVITRSIVTAVTDTDVPGKMIVAYPNPFNGPVTIKGFQVSKQYTLSLFDMQGKLILKKRVYQQNKAEINVQGRGNYILQINDDTKKRLLGSLQIIRI